MFGKYSSMIMRMVKQWCHFRQINNHQVLFCKTSVKPKKQNPKLAPAEPLSRQLLGILSIPQPKDMDLLFFKFKMEDQQLELTQQIQQQLKLKIQKLSKMSFQNLPALIEMLFMLGNPHPSKNIVSCFLENIKKEKVLDQRVYRAFPSYFLKKVAFQIIEIQEKNDIASLIDAVKNVGELLSLNELKRLDELSVVKLQFMSLPQMIRLLTIYRQLKRKGEYCQEATQKIIHQKHQLSPKELVISSINFIQLEDIESYEQLQGTINERMQNFGEGDVKVLMNLLHKFKVGNSQMWNSFIKFYGEQKLPLQCRFIVLSGLHRNYEWNSQLFSAFMETDPEMKYVPNLKENQFIELFLVIYPNLQRLSPNKQSQYIKNILAAIQSKELSSIYLEIKNFFLFLYSTKKSLKKEHLIKSYPDETLQALLSLCYKLDIILVDQREAKMYEDDLVERFGRKTLEDNLEVIVVEEFVRYKLMGLVAQKDRK